MDGEAGGGERGGEGGCVACREGAGGGGGLARLEQLHGEESVFVPETCLS